MPAITYAQVQELVTRIPAVKLPIAYDLLTKLAQERIEKLSPQQQFLLLSFEEQQRLLEEQAAEMVEHYQQTTDERNEWQSGDFIEY